MQSDDSRLSEDMQKRLKELMPNGGLNAYLKEWKLCKLKSGYPPEQPCGAATSGGLFGFQCTLPKGHRGLHHAHGLYKQDGKEECLKRWKTIKTKAGRA